MKRPEGRGHPAPGASAGAGRSPGGADDDVIEMGGHPALRSWPGTRGPAIGLALAALAAGLLLGFLGGHFEANSTGRPARSTGQALTTVPQVGPWAIAATGHRCAVQRGSTLQLGIEIVNQSGRPVALGHVKSALPVDGMRAIASQWATCGSLPELGEKPATSLAAAATAWLTITFEVMVRCPGGLPVQFSVGYLQSGKAVTAHFDSFPDLGQVPYSGCGAHQ